MKKNTLNTKLNEISEHLPNLTFVEMLEKEAQGTLLIMTELAKQDWYIMKKRSQLRVCPVCNSQHTGIDLMINNNICDGVKIKMAIGLQDDNYSSIQIDNS